MQSFLAINLWFWVKLKWSRYRPCVAQRMTAALEGGEWSAARPGRTLPPGKTRYPFYRRLGGPPGRSGREENLFPTGIRTRTVQPVFSRYIDWATRPTYGSGGTHAETASKCRTSAVQLKSRKFTYRRALQFVFTLNLFPSPVAPRPDSES